MESLKKSLCDNPIIPSVVSLEELNFFLKCTDHPWVCLKMGSINSLPSIISAIHKNSRKAMIHLDSVKGISKDSEGITYLKKIGTDAIITMKSQNLKMIRDKNIPSILGTFLVDSSAIQQTLLNIRSGKPDAVLIMPMTVPGDVYRQIAQKHDCILAGGLGSTHEIIQNTLGYGVCACIISDRKRITEIYE